MIVGSRAYRTCIDEQDEGPLFARFSRRKHNHNFYVNKALISINLERKRYIASDLEFLIIYLSIWKIPKKDICWITITFLSSHQNT